MKDIKTKEHNRSPKVLEKAFRMPKELAKKTMLEAKEKSLEGSRLSEGAEHQESPVGYASDKTEGAAKRIAEDTGRAGAKASYAAGRKAAKKTYEKLRGQKRTAENGTGESGSGTQANQLAPQAASAKDPAEAGRKKARSEAAKKQLERVRDRKKTAGTAQDGQEGLPAIRTRETQGQAASAKIVREKAAAKAAPAGAKRKLSVKQAPRVIKSSSLPGRSSYKVSASAVKQAQAAKAAKQAAVKAMQSSAVRAQRTATAVVRFKRAVEATVKTVRNALVALAAGAGRCLWC